jgi:hypothetical protein
LGAERVQPSANRFLLVPEPFQLPEHGFPPFNQQSCSATPSALQTHEDHQGPQESHQVKAGEPFEGEPQNERSQNEATHDATEEDRTQRHVQRDPKQLKTLRELVRSGDGDAPIEDESWDASHCPSISRDHSNQSRVQNDVQIISGMAIRRLLGMSDKAAGGKSRCPSYSLLLQKCTHSQVHRHTLIARISCNKRSLR